MSGWRRLLGRAAPRAAAPAPAVPWEDRTLFVLGAARSGTTVLQNALNHAADVFLLGEPDLDDTGAGFAARYNAMHRAWGNQETKSTFLAPAWSEDGGWEAHLARLSERHRWVGAKVVLNAGQGQAALDRVFALHSRRFYGARRLFAFRDPEAVALSTRALQQATGHAPDDPTALMGHYAAVVALFVRMLRNLPHVRAVALEDVDASTFEALGEWLGVPLQGAAAYYDAARVRTHTPASLDAEARARLDTLGELYADLRALIADGVDAPQLEQNDAGLDPAHYTLLGSIDRRARTIAAALGAPRPTGRSEGEGDR